MVTQVSRSLQIEAPAQTVWETLAGFADISAWASNVDHSAAATDARGGVDAVRRVQVGRQALLERVTQWVPLERLSYCIEGLPKAAGDVETTWDLQSRSGGTLTTVTTTIDPMPRPPGPVVARLLARRMGSAADTMLNGLASHLRDGQEQM